MLSHFYNPPPGTIKREDDLILLREAFDAFHPLPIDPDHAERVVQRVWDLLQTRRPNARPLNGRILPAIGKDDEDVIEMHALTMLTNLPRNLDRAERLLRHVLGLIQLPRAIGMLHDEAAASSDNIISLKSA